MARSVTNAWRDAIRDDRNLDRSAKLVAFVIATYFDQNGRCYPSKPTIARGAGFDAPRAVDRAIDRLEDAGYLSVARSRGGSSNTYQATFPTPHDGTGSTAYGSTGSTPHDGTGSGGANPVPSDAQPRTGRRSTPYPGTGKRFESVEQAPNGGRLNGAAVAEDICPICETRYTFELGDERAALGCPDCIGAAP